MDEKTYQAALADVASRFKTPQAVLDAPDLKREQKIALLKQWEHDLRLMMIATEENMGAQRPTQKPGGSAEAFSGVRKALDALGAIDGPEGASKLGGGTA